MESPTGRRTPLAIAAADSGDETPEYGSLRPYQPEIGSSAILSAIVRNPTAGDFGGRLTIVFDTYISEHDVASQHLNPNQALLALRAAKVTSIEELDGKPCWVRVGGGGMIEFVAMWDLR